MPYITDFLQSAQDIWQNQGQWPQYFPDSTVAGLNPNITGSWDMSTGYGVPYAQAAGGLGLGALGQAVRGANPLNNPFFGGTLDALIRPATQQLTQTVLPQIDSGAIDAGGFGGSRQGIAQGNAINSWQQNVLDTSQKFGSEAYGQGLESLGRAMAMAPGIQQMANVPASIMGQTGDAQRAYEQQMIQDQIDRWNYGQTQPMDMLNWYAGLVGNPLGGTTTSTQDAGRSGGWVNTLGNALAMGGLGASIPGWGAGPGSMFGPAGYAAMAASLFM